MTAKTATFGATGHFMACFSEILAIIGGKSQKSDEKVYFSDLRATLGDPWPGRQKRRTYPLKTSSWR